MLKRLISLCVIASFSSFAVSDEMCLYAGFNDKLKPVMCDISKPAGLDVDGINPLFLNMVKFDGKVRYFYFEEFNENNSAANIGILSDDAFSLNDNNGSPFWVDKNLKLVGNHDNSHYTCVLDHKSRETLCISSW